VEPVAEKKGFFSKMFGFFTKDEKPVQMTEMQ